MSKEELEAFTKQMQQLTAAALIIVGLARQLGPKDKLGVAAIQWLVKENLMPRPFDSV